MEEAFGASFFPSLVTDCPWWTEMEVPDLSDDLGMDKPPPLMVVPSPFADVAPMEHGGTTPDSSLDVQDGFVPVLCSGDIRSMSEESDTRTSASERSDPRAAEPRKKRKARAPIPVTPEEVEELAQMGLPEPLLAMARRPMTVEELRYFKKERRLFKNKVSAHASRQKHKEFVDGLEEEIRTVHSENAQLKRKLEEAEERETFLAQELERMKAFIGNAMPPVHLMMPSRKKAKHVHDGAFASSTGTVLLVFLLSFGLFFTSFANSPAEDKFRGLREGRPGGRVLLSLEEPEYLHLQDGVDMVAVGAEGVALGAKDLALLARNEGLLQSNATTSLGSEPMAAGLGIAASAAAA